jgi:monoterpene epsilon-lactone hydrolase
MISMRARMVRYFSKQIFKRVSPQSDILMVRRTFEAMQKRKRVAKGVVVREAELAGIACEWLIPPGCDDAPVLYYLHGGAYLMGSPATHRKMVSYIAKAAGMRALLPDYSLAPENPFPSGLNDCIAVYRQLLDTGVSADNVVISGDSAGGGMSMATMLSLRDAGDQLPAAAVLLSPWLDLTGRGESGVTRAEEDPWFRVDDMMTIASMYQPDGELTNPLVSPVFADANSLPPMLIQVGDHEILLSDSTRLTGNITAAGGEVSLQVWPEMWHVFQFFIGQMPESKRAISDIGDYIRGRFHAAAAQVGN